MSSNWSVLVCVLVWQSSDSYSEKIWCQYPTWNIVHNPHCSKSYTPHRFSPVVITSFGTLLADIYFHSYLGIPLSEGPNVPNINTDQFPLESLLHRCCPYSTVTSHILAFVIPYYPNCTWSYLPAFPHSCSSSASCTCLSKILMALS